MAYLLHQLLQKSVQNNSESVAVRHKGQSLTYGELDTQSTRLAAALQTQGVERGDRVGIYLEKSLEAIVAIFGILKAGAVYVPLDPGAPQQRIGFIVKNCLMKVMVGSADHLTKLQTSQPATLRSVQAVVSVGGVQGGIFPTVLAWEEVVGKTAVIPTTPTLIEDDLAYILYTSGSTGTPKGVMISHRASLTFVNWAHDTFNFQATDRVANHAPLHFDLSILDIFSTIKAGATIILVPPSLSVFPRSLADFIAQEQITIWYSVPSALTRLVLYGQLERHNYPHLRTVLFAGEVFPIKYLRQLMEKWPHPRYFNLYGPTETNVCTYYEVTDPFPPERTQPLSIGKACENYETFVLDANNNIVPQGVEGELCARGPGVMSGYWGLPEHAAQSRITFTLHPMLGPEIVYRTGDMVRQEADGTYTYLGRRDGMIKSRGYRIEIGEIESALYSHAGVQEAAVVPIPDDEIGNRIKAFVVANAEVSSAELKAHCAVHLPHYMLPHAFDFLDALPKTSTGKIDKQRLRKGMLKKSVQIGEDTIIYYESSGRGHPVMLVHGRGGDALIFRQQLEGDFGERFRVVAIDLSGHNRESVDYSLQHNQSYRQHAELVARLAEKLNIPHAILFGSSYGGVVVIYASTQLPQAAGIAFCGTLPIAGAGLFSWQDGAIEIMSRMTQPLAVFHGENERFVDLDRLKALDMPTLWREAVQVVMGAGHMPHLEKSAVFNQLLTQYIEDILMENNNG